MLNAQTFAELEAIVSTRKEQKDEYLDGGILDLELERYEKMFQKGHLRSQLDSRFRSIHC